MSLKKSIIKVFTTNIVQLVSNIIIGFVVPAILSVNSYSNLKTYTLYLSYIGLLHFGFIDGLYIKYGGKSRNNINYRELKSEHSFLLITEFFISLLFIIISFFLHNIILFLFGLTIFPYMMQSFHRYVFQAIGDFNKYSIIMNTYTISFLIMNIVLAIIFKSKNYVLYCLATLFANVIAMVFFEINFYLNTRNIKSKISKKNFLIIKIGIFVMLGNLAVMGLFGIDKWFIKIFFNSREFAYYSFAVSMMNIINILVNAISITFYSYLFDNNSDEKINVIKDDLLVLGSLSSISYFPLAIIVKVFIPKYIAALGIISITFSIFPFLAVINALYINLYKINKDEKKYFKVVISMLVLSIIYNIIALLFHSTYCIAIATLATMITWFIYSSVDLKKINVSFLTVLYPIMLSVTFLVFAHFFSDLLGFLLYTITFIVISLICNRNAFKSIKEVIVKKRRIIR